jgi:AAA+ superfamily predicted ATPase
MMHEMDPDELLALMRKSAGIDTPTLPAPSVSDSSESTPLPEKSKNTVVRSTKMERLWDFDSDPQPCTEWDFLIAPTVESIKACLQDNPLLPVFLIENPWPDYLDSIGTALERAFPEYRIVDVDGAESRKLSGFVQRFSEVPPSGVLITCTSRSNLPREFRSLVRSDGYFTLPIPSFERLQIFAKHCYNATLQPEDANWLKWVGPNELIVASILQDKNWLAGLRQLCQQRASTQALGTPCTLDQLYGIEQARNWAKQLFNDIDLARNKKISWNEVDRGALFAGPPGTGKTTVARAIASESGVNFIPVTPVKDWMKGEGLSDCIKLMSATFSLARQQAPTIIFIDEFDSIGNREQFTGQNASWNSQFLNALLTELDGFDETSGIIVIGATNYPENVDPALRRAGRLDRTIQLSNPNVAALAAMYKGKLAVWPHILSQADLDECARSSLGLTGADVEKLVRGARRRARMDGNRAISKTDIEQEIFNIPPDAERQPMTAAALKNTAWHEAGHALVGLLLDSLKDQIRMASILANNDILGFVAMIQSEQNATRTSLLDRLCMTLAGRASEDVVFGTDNVTTGAGGMSDSSDLAVARRIALAFVSSYGFSTVHPNWQTNNGLDDEAAKLVEDQYQRAKKLLSDNRAGLDSIAKALLERQVLSREELLAQLK